MEITIRTANKQDVTPILEIINYEILHSTAIYDYHERSYETQLNWYEDKVNKKYPIIVAESGNKVVGFGTYGPFRLRDAYRFCIEHSIYIHHEYRSMGIGKRLLEELIELAKASGYHTMIAGIDAANAGSYEFHRKFGFIETARLKEVGYKFDRWLDLIFMQLMLSETIPNHNP